MSIVEKKFALANRWDIGRIPEGAKAYINTETGNLVIDEAGRVPAVIQTITANGFTIDHQDARVVILKTNGTYTSSTTEAIKAGSVDGQELLILFIFDTSTASLTVKNNAKTFFRTDWYRHLTASNHYAWLMLEWCESEQVWMELATNDGIGCQPSGGYSHAEGLDNIASGTYAHAEGHETVASSFNAHAEGYRTIASAAASNTTGGYSKAVIAYSKAHGSMAFSYQGDAQYVTVIAKTTTTDATQAQLYVGSSDNITVPTGHCYAFSALIAAKRTETSMECAGYKVEGVIKNDAGTVSIVGSVTVTTLAEDDSSWDVTAEADTTNEALAIKVTGAAGKTIHWVATVNLTEVG